MFAWKVSAGKEKKNADNSSRSSGKNEEDSSRGSLGKIARMFAITRLASDNTVTGCVTTVALDAEGYSPENLYTKSLGSERRSITVFPGSTVSPSLLSI